VSFKAAGFKHDAQFTRVRLSKGRNLKQRRSDFILCEYQTRPDVDLTEFDIQQVRAVYKRDEWRLQFVCRTTIDPERPGEDVAGVDLGICNFAAVSFGGESMLYPGGALTEDEYYCTKQKANCDARPVKSPVSTGRERVARRTSCTHSRKQSLRSAVNGAENIPKRYSRVSSRMAAIGITAGWHSQRFSCSTVVRVFSPRENRS
jgi:transposase